MSLTSLTSSILLWERSTPHIHKSLTDGSPSSRKSIEPTKDSPKTGRILPVEYQNRLRNVSAVKKQITFPGSLNDLLYYSLLHEQQNIHWQPVLETSLT